MLRDLGADTGDDWIDIPAEVPMSIIEAFARLTMQPIDCYEAKINEGGIKTAHQADITCLGGLRPAGEVCAFNATLFMDTEPLKNLSNHAMLRVSGTPWVEYFNPAILQ